MPKLPKSTIWGMKSTQLNNTPCHNGEIREMKTAFPFIDFSALPPFPPKDLGCSLRSLQKFSTSELATSDTSDTPERTSRQRPGSAVVDLERLGTALKSRNGTRHWGLSAKKKVRNLWHWKSLKELNENDIYSEYIWIHDECCKGMHFQATRPFSNTLCLRNTPSLWYPVSLWSLCCGTCGTWDWTWSSKSHRIRCLWGYQNPSLLGRRGTLAGSCNGVHSIEGLCSAFWLLRVLSIQLWFSKSIFLARHGKPWKTIRSRILVSQRHDPFPNPCVRFLCVWGRSSAKISWGLVYLWVWLVGGKYWWVEVSFWKCWNLTSSILKTWGERKPPKHCTTWRMTELTTQWHLGHAVNKGLTTPTCSRWSNETVDGRWDISDI